MYQELSTAQRIAIRAIHDGDDSGIASNTVAALQRKRLVRRNADQRLELTSDGGEAYDFILSSGDGPERLKAMFSFLSPPRRRR